jgi:uncharacterized MnhB-related membrane protein
MSDTKRAMYVMLILAAMIFAIAGFTWLMMNHPDETLAVAWAICGSMIMICIGVGIFSGWKNDDILHGKIKR